MKNTFNQIKSNFLNQGVLPATFLKDNLKTYKEETANIDSNILSSNVKINFRDDRVIDKKSLELICAEYDRLLDVCTGSRSLSEGKTRAASGDLFESLVDFVIPSVSKTLILKKGEDDMLISKSGYNQESQRNNLHVDRHIFKVSNNQIARHAFIECKTYLDASYLTRTVFNFIEIKRSLNQTGQSINDVKFIIVAGQNAISDDTRKYYESFFQELTGNILEIFFINDVKQRVSSKPLYKERYGIDLLVLQNFISFILK